MNVTQQGVITLLKSAATGQAFAMPEGFDIAQAYALTKGHHMLTTLYDGAVRCGICRQEPVMQKLFRGYCKALLVSEGQMRELARVFAVFDANGIDYMPLKGCKMKALYPKPELRMMGDADVLIRLDQYSQIASIMKELGFTERVDSDHELIWTTDSLYLELHKRLLPSYNVDFYRYYGDGWHFAKPQAGTRHAMTAEDELVFLFTHFAKHYRDGGIGCRYVLDLWMYRRANPDLDEDYVRTELSKLKLLEFYDNICRVIAVWFEDAEADEKTDFITDFVFASGSWGTELSKTVSEGVRARVYFGSTTKGKRKQFLQMAFPSASALHNKYPILRKAPWMLPLVWVYRPFYKVLFDRDSLKKHRQKMKLMTEEKVETRQQALRYVGLDYHVS